MSGFQTTRLRDGGIRVLRDHRTVAFIKPRQAQAGELDEIERRLRPSPSQDTP